MANFFSLPKLKICGNVCFQTCVCFQVLWSKAIKLTPTENKKCMKKCSSTQVFPYPPSCSKEAYKTGSNFLYLPFFSAQKALWGWWCKMGAKKVSFIACHLGELYLACTSPKVFPTSLKKFDEQNGLHRASYRVQQKMGNSAAFSREIMRQERSIMRPIMRFF